jgi:hypothetical protein
MTVSRHCHPGAVALALLALCILAGCSTPTAPHAGSSSLTPGTGPSTAPEPSEVPARAVSGSAGPATSGAVGVTGCKPSASLALLPCAQVPTMFTPDPGFGYTSGADIDAQAEDQAKSLGCESGSGEAFLAGGATAAADGGNLGPGQMFLLSTAFHCSNLGAPAISSVFAKEAKSAEVSSRIDSSAPRIGDHSIVVYSDQYNTPNWSVLFTQGSFLCFVNLTGKSTIVSEPEIIKLAEAQQVTVPM